MGKVIRPFCWHQNFVPWVLSAPTLGLYTCIKSWKKKMYKIRLWKHCFETCNKWMKWQDISVDIKTLSPGGCLPLPRVYIHVLNHEKKMYKIRYQRDFFETCNKWPKWQDVPVDIKISSPRCCQPLPGAKYIYKIMKKKCIKSDFKEIFFKTCSKWPKWQEVSVDIKILSPGVVWSWSAAIYIY